MDVKHGREQQGYRAIELEIEIKIEASARLTLVRMQGKN
jgi:hypothetical protein